MANSDDATYFAVLERAALALVETVLLPAVRGERVPGVVYARAAEHYDDKSLANPAMIIGQVNFFVPHRAATARPRPGRAMGPGVGLGNVVGCPAGRNVPFVDVTRTGAQIAVVQMRLRRSGQLPVAVCERIRIRRRKRVAWWRLRWAQCRLVPGTEVGVRLTGGAGKGHR
ncbi:hypothetical protein [Nocardia testacea]|uniref:hypothetical protein n=1 Tax=Nocardia testacea TaxID=248551 RepID=UPI0002DE80BB|nr:hypothetical protein [Nocardia testacea]